MNPELFRLLESSGKYMFNPKPHIKEAKKAEHINNQDALYIALRYSRAAREEYEKAGFSLVPIDQIADQLEGIHDNATIDSGNMSKIFYKLYY